MMLSDPDHRLRHMGEQQAPVRVAILDHTAQLGGVELALVRQMDTLAEREDVEARVILFADGPLVERLRERGHAVEVLPIEESLGTTTRHEAAGLRMAVTSAVGATPFVRRPAGMPGDARAFVCRMHG